MSLDVYLKQPACEHCCAPERSVYDANITHNLTEMADLAGIYVALWTPEEIGVSQASQLIPLLTEGLKKLRADPSSMRRFNPPNGWGDYEGLVAFTEKYLKACETWPKAIVSVWR